MKSIISMMMLVVGFASFASEAQAQDNGAAPKSAGQVSQTKENFWPRGGWDGNNLRISVVRTKLLNTQK